jgi:outer membrane protein assembly factor BamB
VGDLYVFDIATGVKKYQTEVGNTVITPIVVDEHVYVKASSAEVQSFGSGIYNNKTIMGGFPKVEIRFWHEIY